MKDLYNSKRLIGELFGAAIAVVWVCFALFSSVFNIMVLLAVAISVTIIFGVLSGGFLKLSKEDVGSAKNKDKEEMK